jgi:hypothetical protein
MEKEINTKLLEETVKKLMAKGKGILAADESNDTADKRLESYDIETGEKMRQKYRDLFLCTPNNEEYISGVILYDETFNQDNLSGIPFPKHLEEKGIVPGIKLDLGAKDFPGFPDEKMAIKNGIHDDIKRFVDELVKMGYKKNVESVNDKSVLTFGFPGHHHHIHVSRKFGAGQSTPSDTEQIDTSHLTQQDFDDLETVADKTNMDFDELLRKASTGEPIDVQDWVKQNFSFLNENKKIKKRSLKTQENINRIKNLLK